MSDPTVELIHRAAFGDDAALHEVLEMITPPIRYSVADTLRRRLSSAARSRARHEVEDLTQEVLLALLANHGKRLRAWDPERGLPFKRFVELVSRHLVESFLRRRERRIWEGEPLGDGDLDHFEDVTDGPERLVARKELLLAVIALVESELTRQGREIFRLLVMDGLTVPEVCSRTGMTQNAVHIWRSRLFQRTSDAARKIRRGAPADD